MTNAEFVIEAIRSRIIEVPCGLTADELMVYFTGYYQCQKDIIELIEKQANPQNQ